MSTSERVTLAKLAMDEIPTAIAAFVTPTQDPFTMLLMAGPMIVLFELAIQIARVVDKRRAKRAAVEHFHDLGDDEASPLDAGPSPLDAKPSPLDEPQDSTPASFRG